MRKLLIVDDQPSIRKMIRLALRDHFDLEEFADADTAYAQIMKARPDGIVLDVMMPGSLNGYQLCEKIKSNQVLAGIHVVLVTARGQVADQEFGRTLGADAYFVKPFSPLALARHLTGALLPGT
jgi:DNA-binding response OmpR family regulator